MIKGFYILPVIAVLFSCSGTQKITAYDYTCRETGTHHLNNKEEFCQCFGINASDVPDYFIFQKESKIVKTEDSTALSLKDAVADEIVEVVIQRLTAAFGTDFMTNWQLEKTDLPVIFRSFKKVSSEGVFIKVVAVSQKGNFTPRALIKFLPLEYKMKILNVDDKKNKYRE